MFQKKDPTKCFPSASDSIIHAARCIVSPQTKSESYKLAFDDPQFLLRDELRGVRLQLEIMKPELIQQEHRVNSTVVIFGGTRIPHPETAAKLLQEEEMRANREPLSETAALRVRCAKSVLAKSHFYEEARELARLITESCLSSDDCDLVVSTGGGPGIMEAANRGAYEAGGKSIGLNIVLPHEQAPNQYITPELCFQFHYFAMRKMHFLMRARALVAFPGGFGTMDELFELLTIVQTHKSKKYMPIILYGTKYWNELINFNALIKWGTISEQDMKLFRFFDDVDAAFEFLRDELTQHYLNKSS